eukprot:COSAG02_NODE_2005_length_10124_cov_15.739386_10_plen_30_part_00
MKAKEPRELSIDVLSNSTSSQAVGQMVHQ